MLIVQHNCLFNTRFELLAPINLLKQHTYTYKKGGHLSNALLY